MFILLNDEKTLIRLFYSAIILTIQKRSRLEPATPPTPLFVATPLMKSTYEEVQLVILRISSQ